MDQRRNCVFNLGFSQYYSYYDGQSNDARLNTVIHRTAIDNGATCLNYMEVTDLVHSPCTMHTQAHQHDVTEGVVVKDVLTEKEYTVHAKVTVNATGPFIDSILKMHEHARLPAKTIQHVDRIIPSKGIHLVLPGSLCPKDMGIITISSDERVLFILPWQH